MSKPVLLDTYCGAGGCAVGYHRAGFDVVGVDIAPQPRFPFEFHQGDALDFIREHGREFECISASPPCQGYSRMRHLPWLKHKKYPMLIDETRRLLQATGRPYVIENVEDAPLDAIVLCGVSFGLKVYRHRKFESNVLLLAPPHQKHPAVIGHGRMLNDRAQPNADGWVSLPSKGRGMKQWQENGAVAESHGSWRKNAAEEALGIDWMNRDELAQAIPPAFTEYVGRQLLAALGLQTSSHTEEVSMT